MPQKIFFTFIFLALAGKYCQAQQEPKELVLDSSQKIAAQQKISIADTAKAKKYNPKIAIVRSAIIPGWGQATNKKYWKIPLVYGALGTTTYLFFRNVNQYKDSRQAYILATDNDPSNDNQIKQPYYTVRSQPERILAFRNAVRQNADYCVLFFIVFWGVNVADAAVDAHLKTFDVSDDLSLQIKPGYSPMAGTNGISLVLKLGR